MHKQQTGPDELEDEIAKADLGGSHTAPRVRVLHRDDEQDVYERFHREQRDKKPDCVGTISFERESQIATLVT
jgi:hypothetical protein